MKKRFLSLVLAICMLASIQIPAVCAPSDWAINEVNAAISQGLVTDKVTQNYQKDITREEFCELVVRLYSKITDKAISVEIDPFTDTDNTEILKAYALKIVNGVSETEFAPDNTITRQEMCVMLVRTIEAIYGEDFILKYQLYKFADNNDIAEWAFEQVYYAYEKEIVKGVGDNRINPLGTATCEQAIIMLYRLYQNIDACKEEISAETIEIYDNHTLVNDSLTAILNDYVDKNGFVDPEDASTVLELAYAKALELKNSGEIRALSYNKEYNSLSIELKSGLKYVFAPPIEGFAAFGSAKDANDIEIMTFDYFPIWEEIGAETGSTIYNTVLNQEIEYTTMNDCVNMLKKTVPNSKTHWKKNGTSVANIKNVFNSLSADQKYVILWRGHGNLYEHIEEGTDLGAIFWMGEKVTKYKLQKYADDVAKNNIISYNGEFAITNKFFDTYMSSVDKGLFYAGCCYSAADNQIMSSTILDKGFSAYIGSTTAISMGYNANMMYRITQFLSEYEDDTKSSTRTIEEAVNLAKQGEYAVDWYGSATVHLDQNTDLPEFRLLGEWKEAYREYLTKLSKKYKPNQMGSPKFKLAYVNDDNIPELVIIYGSGHMDGPYLFTYLDDEVKQVNSANSTNNRYGVYGIFQFKEKGGLIYTGNMQHGYASSAMWQVNDDMTTTQICILINDEGAVSQKSQATYTFNGNNISKLEYDAKYIQYGFSNLKNDFTVIDYGNTLSITESNIKKELNLKK